MPDRDKDVDQVSGTETTGHEWDGIKELNTPLPRWWLCLFFVCIAWAVVYWIFMPAWPGIYGYTHGVLNRSQRDVVTGEVAALKAARLAKDRELANASLAQIQANPDLLQFALAEGPRDPSATTAPPAMVAADRARMAIRTSTTTPGYGAASSPTSSIRSRSAGARPVRIPASRRCRPSAATAC
ncbi:MAG: cbb3-type cytochrome c oxidase N-terminal domain-containing protein [Rhizomicrobium sp.]